MRTLRGLVIFAILAVLTCLQGAPRLAAQEAAPVWNALPQPAFDSSKAARAENVTLVRDRIRLTLSSGSIQFTQPANGVVFGAAFRGRGRVQIEAPTRLEAQQLGNFLGQATLDMEFSEAVFTFSDDMIDEVGKQVSWLPAAADAQLPELYAGRQRERENVGAEILRRLFVSMYSGDRKRTALFAADLKTSEKGWMHVRFDATNPEEISVGRWTNWGPVILFDTWMSFPAGNRTAAEAFRDPLARELFRIRSYRINAEVTQGAELRATTQVNLEPRGDGDRALSFTLDSNLRVESVKDSSGAALTFFQPRDPKDRNQSYGDFVVVVLREATRAGQVMTLEFVYGGKRVVRKEGNGTFFCQSSGWYPGIENDFASRADFDMTFRSPKRFTFVATGDKISETRDGDITNSTWRSSIPLAVAGFAYGDYKVHVEKAGNIDIEVYANRQEDDVARSIQLAVDPGLPESRDEPLSTIHLGNLAPAHRAKEMAVEMANTIRVFEKYFGPYPYKRLAVSSLPLGYSYGQGWPMLIYLWSLSFIDSTQRMQLGISNHLELTDFFRAHESSHQWWGHRVGWKSYHDQWLSEGFAQFSGNLYVLFRENEKEFIGRLQQDKFELASTDFRGRRYDSIGPVWMGLRLSSADAPRAYSAVVYSKGGYILHMIRMMMSDPRSQEPDARFIRMMHDFTQTFHNQPASTEDFKAIVDKHMIPAMDVDDTRKMDWFFDQYVYGIGMAQYNFKYQLRDAGNGKWNLDGTITQSGVPAGWKDSLPVYVEVRGRVSRVGWLKVQQPVTPFNISLAFKPDKVMLNAKEEILAQFKQ